MKPYADLGKDCATQTAARERYVTARARYPGDRDAETVAPVLLPVVSKCSSCGRISAEDTCALHLRGSRSLSLLTSDELSELIKTFESSAQLRATARATSSSSSSAGGLSSHCSLSPAHSPIVRRDGTPPVRAAASLFERHHERSPAPRSPFLAHVLKVTDPDTYRKRFVLTIGATVSPLDARAALDDDLHIGDDGGSPLDRATALLTSPPSRRREELARSPCWRQGK